MPNFFQSTKSASKDAIRLLSVHKRVETHESSDGCVGAAIVIGWPLAHIFHMSAAFGGHCPRFSGSRAALRHSGGVVFGESIVWWCNIL